MPKKLKIALAIAAPTIPSTIFISNPISLFMNCSASQPAIPPMIMAAIQPISGSPMARLLRWVQPCTHLSRARPCAIMVNEDLNRRLYVDSGRRLCANTGRPQTAWRKGQIDPKATFPLGARYGRKVHKSGPTRSEVSLPKIAPAATELEARLSFQGDRKARSCCSHAALRSTLRTGIPRTSRDLGGSTQDDRPSATLSTSLQ